MPAAPHRGATIIPTHAHGVAVIHGTQGPAPLAQHVVTRPREVTAACGAFREPGELARRALLHRPAPHGAEAARPTWRPAVDQSTAWRRGAIRHIIASFVPATLSKGSCLSIISPLPALRCAYNVSIYNLEAVEISVCSKHSAGGKWPQPWTAGRTVISNAATLELFLQIHKFCHNDHLCDSHGFGCQWRILFASQSRTMCLTRFGIVLRRARHGLGQGFDSCRPHLEASHLSFFAFFLLKTQRGP
jgi:hypothetical protein